MNSHSKLVLFLFFVLTTINNGATIKFWHSWSNEEAAILSSVVAKYETISGNKVVMQGVPFGAFQNRFFNTSLRGDSADVIVGPADWIGVFAEQNLIEPLNKYNNVSESDFIKEAIIPCYYQAKLYGLPESVRILVLYYNKNWFLQFHQTQKI